MEMIRDIEKWWPKLPEHARVWLAENTQKPLPAEVLVALVHTRGYGPAAAHFVDAGEPQDWHFFLTPAETDWIERNA